MATAHPAKFADTLEGITAPEVAALEALEGPDIPALVLPPTLDALKSELLTKA